MSDTIPQNELTRRTSNMAARPIVAPQHPSICHHRPANNTRCRGCSGMSGPCHRASSRSQHTACPGTDSIRHIPRPSRRTGLQKCTVSSIGMSLQEWNPTEVLWHLGTMSGHRISQQTAIPNVEARTVRRYAELAGAGGGRCCWTWRGRSRQHKPGGRWLAGCRCRDRRRTPGASRR